MLGARNGLRTVFAVLTVALASTVPLARASPQAVPPGWWGGALPWVPPSGAPPRPWGFPPRAPQGSLRGPPQGRGRGGWSPLSIHYTRGYCDPGSRVTHAP